MCVACVVCVVRVWVWPLGACMCEVLGVCALACASGWRERVGEINVRSGNEGERERGWGMEGGRDRDKEGRKED